MASGSDGMVETFGVNACRSRAVVRGFTLTAGVEVLDACTVASSGFAVVEESAIACGAFRLYVRSGLTYLLTFGHMSPSAEAIEVVCWVAAAGSAADDWLEGRDLDHRFSHALYMVF